MTIKIWLGDLGAYNNGELRGEWLELPMDEEELRAKYNKYTDNGTQDHYIADWEVPDGVPHSAVGEYEDVFKLNDLAELLEGRSDREMKCIGYLVDDGETLSDAIDKYKEVDFYEGMTLKKVAEQLVDDGHFGEIPDSISSYIDCEAIGRDLGHDGYVENEHGVFRRER